MNNNGYYGDFGSWAERAAYEKHREREEQEPNVVPCYKCGFQTYEESNDPKLNICDECKDIIKATKLIKNKEVKGE